jgi:putative ABC transport system substrate-binding protein
MRRRDFITLFGSGAAAWPLAARAQQRPASPVIGYLASTAAAPSSGFQQGLRQMGYTEGQNVVLEFRSAGGQYDRLASLAADLVSRRVNVICASPTVAALAAKAATASIPIVFSIGDDPVRSGLVSSLSRPTGNITGVSRLATELGQKRLQLLHELVPKAPKIALLLNPRNPGADYETQAARAAADAYKHELLEVMVAKESDFETAFAVLLKERPSAMVVASDNYLASRSHQIVAFTARLGIPAIFPFRNYPDVGGLMSYGTDIDQADRQEGVYAGRILRGANVSDLPVVLPTKFELVINMQTAKALDLTVPSTLLAIADEVIE